ncbi:gas vesicle protein [Marinitenerispora sediminis]|uniref:Gas vesicle protein n=1 Tax=Marinitenerispora sediminis TaxID=1931232 RepID=A0A368T2N4_9ACTN|nr:gas vesicle protein [Marinitenerispora sediminis]RCV47941.1 gas vesicle protein [Marinitenerispora sediminis]RCV51893.1 gas vesicle protein [Marinitenerispora sediminis]RCV55654.1 gas vesicle protein [Marinitenerispora sediminis]
MTEPTPWRSQTTAVQPSGGGSNLADVLERVLDKGVVIAGDIKINLLDIELLTIKLRLLVASVDKAKEMGIDWWEHDPALSSAAAREEDELALENRRLRDHIAALEGEDAPALRAGGVEADRAAARQRRQAEERER